jgi:hypothetical protein
MIRSSILLLTLVAAVLNAGHAYAQHLSTDQACSLAFVPLREEAESRGRLIKAASERHAPLDEVCRLVRNFGQSELRLIKFIEANSEECRVPSWVAGQLKSGHQRTEAILTKDCAAGLRKRAPVGDFDGASNISLRTGPAWPRGPVGDFDGVR